MKENFLFINTNFLEKIKENDLKNNLRIHFIYEIHNEFNKLRETSDKHSFSYLLSKDNDSLFYRKMNKKEIEKNFKHKKEQIENFFNASFIFSDNVLNHNLQKSNDNKINKYFYVTKSKFVKVPVCKAKKERLLSFLILVSSNNNTSMYFLFPIVLKDFH